MAARRGTIANGHAVGGGHDHYHQQLQQQHYQHHPHHIFHQQSYQGYGLGNGAAQASPLTHLQGSASAAGLSRPTLPPLPSGAPSPGGSLAFLHGNSVPSPSPTSSGSGAPAHQIPATYFGGSSSSSQEPFFGSGIPLLPLRRSTVATVSSDEFSHSHHHVPLPSASGGPHPYSQQHSSSTNLQSGYASQPQLPHLPAYASGSQYTALGSSQNLTSPSHNLTSPNSVHRPRAPSTYPSASSVPQISSVSASSHSTSPNSSAASASTGRTTPSATNAGLPPLNGMSGEHFSGKGLPSGSHQNNFPDASQPSALYQSLVTPGQHAHAGFNHTSAAIAPPLPPTFASSSNGGLDQRRPSVKRSHPSVMDHPVRNQSFSHTNGTVGEDEGSDDDDESDGDLDEDSPGNPSGRRASRVAVDGASSKRRNKRRKRAVLSCTECKQRKIKCDRNVPNCASCLRRGLGHLCRWGDERDELTSDRAAVDPSTAALLARIARLETQLAAATAANGASKMDHTAVEGGARSRAVVAKANNASAKKELSISTALDSVTSQSGQIHWLFDVSQKARSTSLMADEVARTLAVLPPRHVVDRMIVSYLDRAEPMQNAFNRPWILNKIDSLFAEITAFQTAHMQGKFAAEGLNAPAMSEDDEEGDASREIQVNGASSAQLPALDMLCLLLAMLASLYEYVTSEELIAIGVDTDDSRFLPQLERYQSESRLLLAMVEPAQNPSLPALMAILLYRAFNLNRNRRDEFVLLNTTAIRMAQSMGLHRLRSAQNDMTRWRKAKLKAVAAGKKAAAAERMAARNGSVVSLGKASSTHSSPSKGPSSAPDSEAEDDKEEGKGLDAETAQLQSMFMPQTSRGHNQLEGSTITNFAEGDHVMREMGRKCWHGLIAFDWSVSNHNDGCYFASPDQFNTAPPANVDDVDVPADGSDFVIQPDNILTDNTFTALLTRMSAISRHLTDLMNRGEGTYASVMEVDERYRQLLRDLPVFYQLNGVSEHLPEVVEMEKRKPYLSFQRQGINVFIHYRLLNTHRMHFLRGYTKQKYQHSAIASATSARAILANCEEIMRPPQPFFIFLFNVFQASIVSQIDLLQRSNQTWTEDRGHQREQIDMVIRSLRRQPKTSGFYPVAPYAIKLLTSLRMEELRRRGELVDPKSGAELARSAARATQKTLPQSSANGLASPKKEPGPVQLIWQHNKPNAHRDSHAGLPPAQTNTLVQHNQAPLNGIPLIGVQAQHPASANSVHGARPDERSFEPVSHSFGHGVGPHSSGGSWPLSGSASTVHGVSKASVGADATRQHGAELGDLDAFLLDIYGMDSALQVDGKAVPNQTLFFNPFTAMFPAGGSEFGEQTVPTSDFPGSGTAMMHGQHPHHQTAHHIPHHHHQQHPVQPTSPHSMVAAPLPPP